MKAAIVIVVMSICISVSMTIVQEAYRKPKPKEVSHGCSKADVPASLPGNGVQKPRSPECSRSGQKGSGPDHKTEKHH